MNGLLLALTLQVAATAPNFASDSVVKLQGIWINSANEAGAYRVVGNEVKRTVVSGPENVGFVMVSNLGFDRTEPTSGSASHYFKGTCHQAFNLPSGFEIRRFPDCMVRVYEIAPYTGYATAISDYSGFSGRRRPETTSTDR